MENAIASPMSIASSESSRKVGTGSLPQAPAGRKPPLWPTYFLSYMPDLEYGRAIRERLEDFQRTLLSDNTSVRVLVADNEGTVTRNENLDGNTFKQYLKASREKPPNFQFISINRHLVVNKSITPPIDANKLRISKQDFHHLSCHFELSPAFISAITSHQIPQGQGSRQKLFAYDPEIFDFWYVLPVRVQVRCTDQTQGHVSSTAGKSQMNPHYYLHLPEQKVDIRGSQIAVYFQFNRRTRSTSVIVVNFLDGRWPKIVEEPLRRIEESLGCAKSIRTTDDPFFVHVIYLTNVLWWWLNVLSSFKDQLIAHDMKVQNELEITDQSTPAFNNEINKALHCMVAHLHRYGSELDLLGDAIEHIQSQHTEFFKAELPRGQRMYDPSERVRICLSQIKSQLRSAVVLRKELESKVGNILNLLFNNIQVANDRMQVANGEAMHKIMKATQDEAKQSRKLAIQSQKLAEKMKEDSIAMKTIAILTLIFLPGTSFAAVLAMPFFDQNSWMGSPNKIWVWFVLTIPSTGMAFVFYVYWRRREMARKEKDAEIELEEVSNVV